MPQLSATGATGKTTARALTGTVTFTGAAAKSSSRLIAAALTFVGFLVRVHAVTLAAALSFTGLQTKRVAKLCASVLTFGFHSFQQALAGVVSFTGATTTSVIHSRVLTAALSFSGSLRRATAHSLAAVQSFTSTFLPLFGGVFTQLISSTLTFTGVAGKTLLRRLAGTIVFGFHGTQQAVSATVGFVGVLIPSFVHRTAFTASAGFTGRLTKGSIKSFLASLSPVGLVLTTKAAKLMLLVSNLGFSGLLAAGKLIGLHILPLSGTLSFTGKVPRVIARKLLGGLTAAGSVTLNHLGLFFQALSATVSFTGAQVKTTVRPFAAVLVPSANLPTMVVRSLAAVLALTTTMGRGVARLWTASLPLSASLAASKFQGFFTQTFNAALTFAGATNYFTRRALTATVSFAGTVAGRIGIVAVFLNASVDFAGRFVKTPLKPLTAGMSFSGLIPARFFRVPFTAAASFVGSTTAITGNLLNVVLTASIDFAGTISRTIGKALDATLGVLSGVFAGIADLILTAASAVLDTHDTVVQPSQYVANDLVPQRMAAETAPDEITVYLQSPPQ